MTEDERMQIAALGPASAGAVFDAVQPTFFKLVLPVGALAFLAAAASLATCYGSILATAFLGVPAERVMNPHLQAAMMWGFALLAVYALWRARRRHRRNAPLMVGPAALAILVGALPPRYQLGRGAG